MKENFDERLIQEKSAAKYDIADFIKETYFDEKLINVNRKVTSNKAKHVRAEKKTKCSSNFLYKTNK